MPPRHRRVIVEPVAPRAGHRVLLRMKRRTTSREVPRRLSSTPAPTRQPSSGLKSGSRIAAPSTNLASRAPPPLGADPAAGARGTPSPRRAPTARPTPWCRTRREGPESVASRLDSTSWHSSVDHCVRMSLNVINRVLATPWKGPSSPWSPTP